MINSCLNSRGRVKHIGEHETLCSYGRCWLLDWQISCWIKIQCSCCCLRYLQTSTCKQDTLLTTTYCTHGKHCVCTYKNPLHNSKTFYFSSKSQLPVSPPCPQHASKVQLQLIPIFPPLPMTPKIHFLNVTQLLVSSIYHQCLPIWKTFKYYVLKVRYFTPIYYALQFHYLNHVCPALIIPTYPQYFILCMLSYFMPGIAYLVVQTPDKSKFSHYPRSFV